MSQNIKEKCTDPKISEDDGSKDKDFILEFTEDGVVSVPEISEDEVSIPKIPKGYSQKETENNKIGLFSRYFFLFNFLFLIVIIVLLMLGVWRLLGCANNQSKSINEIINKAPYKEKYVRLFKIKDSTERADADSLFKRGQIRGDADSLFKLGQIYENGELGIKKNPFEALIWYLGAAEQNHPQALYKMGIFYQNGGRKDRRFIKELSEIYKMAISCSYFEAFLFKWRRNKGF